MIRLKVKEIAMQKGFNQATLAREAEIGFTTARFLFNDPYHGASLSVLERVAKALGVSIFDLIEEVPDEPEENKTHDAIED